MAGTPEQDIAHLEALLRQLEQEYDKFLCGQERREPTGTEKAVLTLVRAYASRPLQNSTLAFKYASLVARYNSFRTAWTRRLREKEEGRGPLAGGGRPLVAPREINPHRPVVPGNPAEYLAAEPQREERRLQQFFQVYRQLRVEAGESVAKLQPEGFRKALTEKIEKIKRDQGCEAVLLRVVTENGRTRLVAKAFRRGGGRDAAGR